MFSLYRSEALSKNLPTEIEAIFCSFSTRPEPWLCFLRITNYLCINFTTVSIHFHMHHSCANFHSSTLRTLTIFLKSFFHQETKCNKRNIARETSMKAQVLIFYSNIKRTLFSILKRKTNRPEHKQLDPNSSGTKLDSSHPHSQDPT